MLAGNDLLGALRPAEQTMLLPFVDEITLQANQTLFERGDRISHCYFPREGAAVSYFVVLEDSGTIETVTIGREGALGAVIGGRDIPTVARACVMHPGGCYRIASTHLRRAMCDSAQIRSLFARYAVCLMAQMFQGIACNASHTIEQRAAKWLCAAVERTRQHGITITQEQLAGLMGSGRSYASRVVQRFKRDELLVTRRGGLEVLDYDGLLERACGCNAQVRGHFDVVLNGAQSS